MGKDTAIQWCDSTVNPTTGCDGCELHAPGRGGPCYAGIYHETRMARAIPALYDPTFTRVRLAPGRTKVAAGWTDLRGVPSPGKPWIPPDMPRLIFVSDMADALSRDVPFDYLKAEVADVAASPKGRRHSWLWLTKRPSRMAEFGLWLREEAGVAWPDNLWAGTSITSAKTERRAEMLAHVPAKVKFLSMEPLRESVLPAVNLLRNFAMVIVGGESAKARADATPFDLCWARDVVGLCRSAGASPFVKQLGSLPYDSSGPGRAFCAANMLELRDSHGGDWDEWPYDLQVREFPAAGEVAGA